MLYAEEMIDNTFFIQFLKFQITNQIFLTIYTTSSSSKTWARPTFWGVCLALVPHTNAYLMLSAISLWMVLQKSTIVHFFLLRITGSLKSGISPFGLVYILMRSRSFQVTLRSSSRFQSNLAQTGTHFGSLQMTSSSSMVMSSILFRTLTAGMYIL